MGGDGLRLFPGRVWGVENSDPADSGGDHHHNWKLGGSEMFDFAQSTL